MKVSAQIALSNTSMNIIFHGGMFRLRMPTPVSSHLTPIRLDNRVFLVHDYWHITTPISADITPGGPGEASYVGWLETLAIAENSKPILG